MAILPSFSTRGVYSCHTWVVLLNFLISTFFQFKSVFLEVNLDYPLVGRFLVSFNKVLLQSEIQVKFILACVVLQSWHSDQDWQMLSQGPHFPWDAIFMAFYTTQDYILKYLALYMIFSTSTNWMQMVTASNHYIAFLVNLKQGKI